MAPLASRLVLLVWSQPWARSSKSGLYDCAPFWEADMLASARTTLPNPELTPTVLLYIVDCEPEVWSPKAKRFDEPLNSVGFEDVSGPRRVVCPSTCRFPSAYWRMVAFVEKL